MTQRVSWWKTQTATVALTKPSKKQAELMALIETKMQDSRECMIHELEVHIFKPNAYRRYRRGKNRCERCGLKKAYTMQDFEW